MRAPPWIGAVALGLHYDVDMRLVPLVLLAACADPASLDTALDTGLASARVQFGEPAVLTIETDAGADGSIDRITESTFDARGDRVMEREDRDGDGRFERLTTFVHHREGNRVVRIDADDQGDGHIDGIESRAFDAAGRISRMEHDADADGRAERWEEMRWDGPRHTVRRFAPGSPAVETVYTDVFGPDGRAMAVEVDKDADGRSDNRMERRWKDGLLAEIRTDAAIDGDVDGITRYRYDAQGRLVGIAIDAGGDGKADTLITRHYRGTLASDRDCL